MKRNAIRLQEAYRRDGRRLDQGRLWSVRRRILTNHSSHLRRILQVFILLPVNNLTRTGNVTPS